MTESDEIVAHPLDLKRWPDLQALFAARGCSFAKSCWCMGYRQRGQPAVPAGSTLADVKRSQLQALAMREPAPGLIAYRGRQPVGWVAVGPRSDFMRLQRSPVMAPVDAVPVWSVVCFVVPSAFRHQGVAHALLRAAARYAAQHGATVLEGYPIDKAERSADGFLWHGTHSMFERAGFTEVARRKPERPIMRLALERGLIS